MYTPPPPKGGGVGLGCILGKFRSTHATTTNRSSLMARVVDSPTSDWVVEPGSERESASSREVASEEEAAIMMGITKEYNN